MLETKDVFNRKGAKSSGSKVSGSKYNLYIGLTLLWGFAVNYYIVSNIPADIVLAFGHWPFLIGYFISCFFGIYLFTKSTEPMISFIGYNLVVVPFGFVINIVVAKYNSDVVLEAIQITGTVTAGMMILGSLFPNFFKKTHTVLVISLFLMIIIQLVDIFILGQQNPEWIDWVVAVIFCGYIGYDWGRANQIPKTMDNAIDSAAALYMDIINLFFRILRILGRRR